MSRSDLALVFVLAIVADAGWKPFDGSPEPAKPGQGKGDCKGAATPVQSKALGQYVTIDDCIEWLQTYDCQGPAWLADPGQPKCSDFGTATALGFKVGWENKPSGQCRAWFKNAPSGQNGDKPWDCFVPDYANYPVPEVVNLIVKNTASSRVMLRDASCKANDAPLESGQSMTIGLETGAHKYWVVPENCTEAEGCFRCGLDCTGCFYIAPIVGSNGVAVTGIGYGHNTPVEVHEGISGAHLSATNQLGQPDFVDCTTTSCNFNHIIQAHGSMLFTLEGPSSQASIVV